MTPRDDFTEPDLVEAASAVYDGEASEDERTFVEGHFDGPTLLAAYEALRNDLREINTPDEDAFSKMRARALAATHSEVPAPSMAALATAASPTAAASDSAALTTSRPVTNLASKRSLRSLGPKLVGVAAVAIIGIGAIAIANLGRDSSSSDSSSPAMERTELDTTSGDATAESNATAPSDADGESTGDLTGPPGGIDSGYFGSFDTVADLEAFYRQHFATLASPAPQSDGADSGSGASGLTNGKTSSGDSLNYQACGDHIARATLAGQEVILLDAVDQIRVLNVPTCAVVATFAP